MEISREDGVVHLSQKRYSEKFLERFNMHMSKPVITTLALHFKLSELQMPHSMDEVEHMLKVPYASAVGSIMYAIVCTHPDIAQSATPDVGITFRKSEGISILGYIDSDSAVDLDQRGPQLDTSLLSLAVPLVGNRLYNLVSLCLQPRQNILQQRRQ
uniref:Reverse transcriptase Ty1/copia-type domain-containing protein n=1 Tax=Solanum lycopersicum TaxID=4081 RepID=A0A3Q7FPS9_SOLLC